ncbi:MAG: glycosyl hydrolase 108 family protein [Rhodospirillaceae bacterium]
MDRINQVILTMVSRFEGTTYSNDPADRGGPTRYGITQRTYGEYLGKPVTPDQVRTMPWAHALAIYRERYWRGANIDLLPEPLQPVIFDMAVNMGPGTAARLLQHALGDLGRPVIGDGRIGKITSGLAARAVADFGAKRVVDTICDRRRDYYQDIISHDPSQAAFRHSWLERCESYRLPVGS